MKNTFKTIRTVAVAGIAFFAFAQSAFAAPVITPVVVTDITGTSANLDVYISNPGKNTCAWFEWTAGSSMSSGTPVGRQCFYGDGYIKTTLTSLAPGATYSYRASAIEGGVIVSSPVSSFTTTGLGGLTSAASSGTSAPAPVSSQTNTTQSPAQISYTNTSVYTNTAPAPAQKKTVTTSSVKQVAATVPTPGADGFTNGNSAAIIGAGNSILPTTLIGWIGLLIMTLIAVILGHMIYESAEKRREERERKEKEEEEGKEEEAE